MLTVSIVLTNLFVAISHLWWKSKLPALSFAHTQHTNIYAINDSSHTENKVICSTSLVATRK